MNTRTLSITAIALWLVTIAVLATMFVRGNTTTGSDDRTAVVLNTPERNLVLAEMRGLLTSTQAILDGLNRNDMKLVADAARAVGMGSAADVNPGLMAKLPLSFKQMGMGVHHEMDTLADAAQAGKSPAEIQGMLSNTLSTCVACHSAWQLKAAD
jgi:cytochrome c556